MSLAAVETKTKQYADAFGKLKAEVSTLESEIALIKKKYLPNIKKLAESATAKHDVLKTEIKSNPGCFENPRTYIFHGIKVGMQKGKGKIEFNAKQTVKLIKKHYPDKMDVLIQTSESPVKKALNQLTMQELKKIGVNVIEAQDEILIKATDSEIQKFVDALLADDRQNNQAA